MKLIHCADIHLDSSFSANFDKEKARERKTELLRTFVRMTEYAADNGIDAVLIAGDLFDKDVVSAMTRNGVIGAIEAARNVLFYYLKGNHDRKDFFGSLSETPENLKTFNDKWTSYKLSKKVTLYGLEFNSENYKYAADTLVTDPSDINIVMLHGQESPSASDRTEIINLKSFKNRNIDYMALGHVHAYKNAVLDARGRYCYPGCLEGRGFDESGEHGFVVLDIDERSGKIETSLINIDSRKFINIEADITGLLTTRQMTDLISGKLEACGATEEDYVRVVLKGQTDVEAEKNEKLIAKTFEEKYCLFRLYDESTFSIDYESYAADRSLKGEFIRTVKDDVTVPDDKKASVIRYGIRALLGEDIIE
ncbi:MAG: DNA repair exonuclease [Lachnospiraceae bacterium]|nr:DNA repair exonuclease [Lachnospiraceae bacterium]